VVIDSSAFLSIKSLPVLSDTVNAMCVITAGCHVQVYSWSYHASNPNCNVKPSGIPGYVKLKGNVIFNKSSCDKGPGISRGTHIQLIDPFTCSRIEYKRFDTYKWGHTGDAEAEKLSKYLDQLGDFSVIVGSMTDEASGLTKAIDALLRVGVDLSDIPYKGSYAFVTQKSTNKTVLNKATTEEKSQKNPAHVNVIITGMYNSLRYRDV